AGMKDKQGITRQWFSVHNGLKQPVRELGELPPGVRVLQRLRNQRKLQRGSHSGNCFRIRLRSCSVLVGSENWQQRVQQIAAVGVPNYFGPQRFGRQGDNVQQVANWFADESRAPRSRNQRSLLLSSARSFIFNAVLSERVAQQSWNRALPGEELALSGSTRTFAGTTATAAELQQRLDEFDIHPTGPLWGKGANKTSAQVAELEAGIAARYPQLTEGLHRHGLSQERRPLRLQVCDLQSELETDVLNLHFRLARGAYATAVLRELVNTELS
ncbi:MAG: tRNA pseudouridine(13) synthase TruD, partial [Pseudomonadota bacterium]